MNSGCVWLFDLVRPYCRDNARPSLAELALVEECELKRVPRSQRGTGGVSRDRVLCPSAQCDIGLRSQLRRFPRRWDRSVASWYSGSSCIADVFPSPDAWRRVVLLNVGLWSLWATVHKLEMLHLHTRGGHYAWLVPEGGRSFTKGREETISSARSPRREGDPIRISAVVRF